MHGSYEWRQKEIARNPLPVAVRLLILLGGPALSLACSGIRKNCSVCSARNGLSTSLGHVFLPPFSSHNAQTGRPAAAATDLNGSCNHAQPQHAQLNRGTLPGTSALCTIPSRHRIGVPVATAEARALESHHIPPAWRALPGVRWDVTLPC